MMDSTMHTIPCQAEVKAIESSAPRMVNLKQSIGNRHLNSNLHLFNKLTVGDQMSG